MVSNDGIKIGVAGDAYMRRGIVLAVFFSAVILAATLAVGLAATGSAAAQTTGNNTTDTAANTTANASTSTPTPAPTDTPGTPDGPDTPDTAESNASTPGDDDGETIESDDVTKIDSKLKVTEWSYDATNEQFVITFESTSVTGSRVSLSERIDTDRGATRYNIRQERISGTETIEFDARQWGGEAGVSIVTQRALQETGTGVVISTGERDGSDPFNTPGPMGWFGGVTVGIVTGLVAFRRRLRGGNGGPKSAWGEW